MGSFSKAVREKLRLRMAIDGPSGSGKSVTALRCALALSPSKKIAVIDSEHGSARKYIGEDYGEGSIDFDVCELKSYSPSNYTSLINEASRGDFEVVIVDSLSHAWEGKDGALELVNKKGGNSFTAWKDVTPMHQAMIQAILDAGCHVIVTMRSKTEYVLEENERGKQVPRKVGMAPVQRAGMEYEFDVYLSMDWSHIGTVTKSRCRAVDGLIVAKPGADFMRPIIEWLEYGEAAKPRVVTPGISQEQLEELAGLLNTLGIKQTVIEKSLPAKFGVRKVGELNTQQAASVLSMLRVDVKNKAEREAAIAAQAAEEKATQQPEQSATTVEQPAATSAGATATNGHATAEQISKLLWFKDGIPVSDKDWQAAIAKRGVTELKDLTSEQAAEMLAKLAAKLAPSQESKAAFDAQKEGRKKKPAAEAVETTATAAATAATTAKPDVPFEMATSAPEEADPSNAAVAGKATKEQVEEMVRYRQSLNIPLTTWSAILAKRNVSYEGDLSYHDADTLLAGLEKKLQQKTASDGLNGLADKMAGSQPTATVSTKN